MRQLFRRTARVITLTLAFLMLLSTSAFAALGQGRITASSLRLRAAASTDSDTLAMIPYGAEVELVSQEGAWYLTSFGGQTGYIHSDYVEILPEPTIDDLATLAMALVTGGETSSPAAAPADAQAVVDMACEYLGVRYRYGGASPSGFDCSGFTMYIYRHFGFSLPHTATGQLSHGTSISRDELQMGDLVFFRDTNVTRKAASHVGIYIGGNNFVHASSSSTGRVLISSLDERYFARYYVGARRLLDQ